MLEKFDAAQVWSSLLAVKTKQADRPNMFMGVPAMYGLLIQEYDKIFANNPRMKEYVHAVCSEKIRYVTDCTSRRDKLLLGSPLLVVVPPIAVGSILCWISIVGEPFAT
jgi:hypothetical protein